MKPKLEKITLRTTGKITIGRDQLTGEPIRVVYQRTRKGAGNIKGYGSDNAQVRAMGPWTDARTPAQLAHRAKFAAAVTAWQALTPEAKAVWYARAKHLKITAYNLYIREHSRGAVP